MKPKLFIVIISFAFATLFILVRHSPLVRFDNVRVDQDLVKAFESLPRKPEMTIMFNSHGGLPSAAHAISKQIQTRHINIIVDKECLSACAETVLPSSNNIRFKNRPLIGYHWNSIMTFDQKTRYGGSLEYCDLTNVEKQVQLLESKNMNVEYWRETEKRLNLKFYKVVPKIDRCSWKRRAFENRMWLPTSEQLRNIMKLKFTGKVCADIFQECSRRIDRRWPKGTRLVVGDEIYISKGR